MDSAYDHIQQETYPEDGPKQESASGSAQPQANNFNAEFQDAYKAISSSPWAARIGGFFGTVKKQGEQYIDNASKQYAPTVQNATAGVSSLISHARKISLQAGDIPTLKPESSAKDGSIQEEKEDMTAHPDRPESLPADIVREAESMLSRFRSEATKRFKDMEKAEDAADEALLKFGTNIRNFLSEAVSIAPPASGSEADTNAAVLFESKDSSGKKVVHATRFDAQLHVIHSSLDSFLKDPTSPQWEEWKTEFDVEKKTDAIAKDLEKHDELRSAMEKVVPERVDYAAFWCRYYFLRHVIESEEQRRKDLLKASTPADEEEVAWGEDTDEEESDDNDDDESDAEAAAPKKQPAPEPSQPPQAKEAQPPTSPPKQTQPPKKTETSDSDSSEASSEEDDDSEEDSDDESTPPTTSTAPPPSQSKSNQAIHPAASKETLKPTPLPRRSNDEKSVADSDASYDLVSGATSRATGSPLQGGADREKRGGGEESEEEDWE
ncbi:hypothetical protein P153DRAFT_435855 [Dothidotthia symphoricarpi CBS 119687]|uniref:BSD domain-containing protein n=1 Tax=Dothidotthia symphoricarpi CBS 119687 TaxID=1392245 RepID=A0A6A5ZX96_9PLEO|nr:uncharacterized protein P153DRAFT_435855 [Dothidotthia symphoricarpi CBS 119687]KAF2123523.1 hypothetical protein P153DRAFT_435855 [Dothidotthia symphoricarpi CBS 119687]